MLCNSGIEFDLGTLLRSVKKTIMGCFFGCFRVKDDNQTHHIISDSSNKKDSRNRLAELLLSESPGENEVSPISDKEITKELIDEAKFLKSCGTLAETPAEIRKTYAGVDHSTTPDGDSENNKFHSWMPSTSIKKLQWEEEQLNQVSDSSAKLSEEPVKESDSSEHQPSSSVSGEQKFKALESNGVESPDASSKTPVQLIDDDASSPVSQIPIEMTQCKNKSVRFDCDPSSAQSSNQSDSNGSNEGSKWSPYPTPLKITDEMQTPGTVYATNPENLTNGKNPRIRCQYVYPAGNPAQEFTQWNVLNEEDENTTSECTSVSYSSQSVVEHDKEAKTGEHEAVVEFSKWLSSSPKSESVGNYETLSSERSHSKTPEEDRPILGTVAAHWNDDESTRISSKWWDGNGIPNSTNKYKEDQKVSWHATPFEVRLEKALSDETLVNPIPRRLHDGRPIHFEELEEGDSAMSKMKTSAHPESVVSF
ncbi:protein JASON-like isoform X1 [Papaver somniferum]|uniref:protein JASON-like isoform X1 n=1 Tax=Papaver somniferum TaxID=3469 RepID=UPI000E6FEFCC|nr:protein JASON-like isoform X1 [Papaver somniferum]